MFRSISSSTQLVLENDFPEYQHRTDPSNTAEIYLNVTARQITNLVYLQKHCSILASGILYTNPELWKSF